MSTGFLVWHLNLRWRAEFDRALAPLELTSAQYAALAGCADEVVDGAGQFVRLVLLHELSGVLDDPVRLAVGARDAFPQRTGPAADALVLVAEGAAEGGAQGLEDPPRPAVRP